MSTLGDSSNPDHAQSPFEDVPAPWDCKGEAFWFNAYIRPTGNAPPPASFGELEQTAAFSDSASSGEYKGGLASVMVVRYRDTPVGECI